MDAVVCDRSWHLVHRVDIHTVHSPGAKDRAVRCLVAGDGDVPSRAGKAHHAHYEAAVAGALSSPAMANKDRRNSVPLSRVVEVEWMEV